MKDFLITFKSKKEICENTVAFYFDSSESGYKFEAGQYAHFTLIDPDFSDEKGNSRPFSFAGSPHNKNEIMIAARINSSVFINNLSGLSTGSKIYISKPAGNLNLKNNISDPAVFIAGGIGITPARSLIENEILEKSNRNVTLFYSNKTESQSAFLDEFKIWSFENKKFRFIPLIEDLLNDKWKYETGLINNTLIGKYLKDPLNNHYYLTGPSPMIASVRKMLADSGVSNERINTEIFS